jgi:hypothetical protein
MILYENTMFLWIHALKRSVGMPISLWKASQRLAMSLRQSKIYQADDDDDISDDIDASPSASASPFA